MTHMNQPKGFFENVSRRGGDADQQAAGSAGGREDEMAAAESGGGVTSVHRVLP